MDQQVSQQMQQQLQDQWDQIYPAILDRFTTVSKSDIDAARTTDDLVTRIADKTGHSERLVENTLHELVSAGGGQAAQQKPFSAYQRSAGAGQGQQGGNRN